jgi:hypothetical protein
MFWIGVAFVGFSLPAAIYFWFKADDRANALAERYARQQRRHQKNAGTQTRVWRR